MISIEEILQKRKTGQSAPVNTVVKTADNSIESIIQKRKTMIVQNTAQKKQADLQTAKNLLLPEKKFINMPLGKGTPVAPAPEPTFTEKLLNLIPKATNPLQAAGKIVGAVLPKDSALGGAVGALNEGKSIDEVIQKFKSGASNTASRILPTTGELQAGGKSMFAQKNPTIVLSDQEKQLAESNKNKQENLSWIASGATMPVENIANKVGFNAEKYVAEQKAKQEAARSAGSPGIIDKAKNFLNEIKVKLVDSNAPIEDTLSKFQKETQSEILPKFDISHQIDRVYRAPTMAGQFMRDNGLESVIKNVDNIDNLDQYLIAKQAKTVATNGIETGRKLANDQQLIDAFAPKYEKAAQEVNKYSRNLLDYSVDAGLIDKKIAADLKIKYPDYVPINRVFSELEKTGEFRNPKAVASLSKQTVVQGLKGSEREIDSPIASLLVKTNDAFVQGEKNKAARMLTDYGKLPSNPFEITPLRTAENVKKRIDIFTELGQSRPVKDKLERLITTRNRWARSIQSELNQLNKEGIQQYLKRKPVEALQKTATLKTKPIFGKATAYESTGEKFTVNAKVGEKIKLNPLEFSSKDIKNLVNDLIDETPEKINAIRDKIVTRDKRLTATFDDILSLQKNLNEVKATRNALFDEAKLVRDAESRGKATISVLRDGIKEIYETTPEIAQAAKSLSVQQLNILGKIFALPVRIARVGITGINLPFVASNIAKDQITAVINSKNALKTSIANPLNFIKALYEAVGHGKLYQEMVREGAGGTSFDIARNQAPQTIEKIRASKNIGSKILYTVKNPAELLRSVENIVGRSEELTRIQQYAGTKQALLAKGMTQSDAVIGAAKAARENTVNFARRGEWGTVLNSVFLYLNASIQGTRTFVRGLQTRPVQTATKLGIAVFTPIAATTLWNLSDPKRKAAYEDIAEYEKENNIIIVPPNPTQDENGKWNVIKIPLSQEVNNIASLARRPIEQSFGLDPLKASEVAQAFLGTVLPINMNKDVSSTVANTVVPQAIKPTLEAFTNKNFFTGFKQVPASMEKLSPEMQVKKNTSGTAIKIGNAIGASPIKVEEFIKGTAGGVAMQGLNLSDRILAGLNIIPKDQIHGQNIIDAILARFNKASGGQLDEKSNAKLSDILTNQADERFRLKQEAEILHSELKKMPKDEANARANEIKKTNPELFQKLKDTAEADKKGLDYNDRLILQLGVENGERAKFIFEAAKGFKTKEEKNNYVNEMRKKGIISDNVFKQLVELKSKEN